MLDHDYYKVYSRMTPINLSKQEALNVDPKAIQQINFTGNLPQHGDENVTIFLVTEKKLVRIFKMICGSF